MYPYANKKQRWLSAPQPKATLSTKPRPHPPAPPGEDADSTLENNALRYKLQAAKPYIQLKPNNSTCKPYLQTRRTQKLEVLGFRV